MIPGVNRSVFSLYDVMMYVAMARKHLRLMLLLFSFAITTGLMVYVYARPVYYSRASVHMAVLALPIDTEKLMQDSNLATLGQQIASGPILERVAKQLGVEANARDIQESFVKKISVGVKSKHELEIQVWTYTYTWAKQLPELIVREFLKEREERRIQFHKLVTSSFGPEKLEIYKKLNKNLDERYDFQSQKNATEAQIKLNEITLLPDQMALIGRRLSVMEDIKKHVEDPSLDIVSKLALIFSVDKDADIPVGHIVNPAGDLKPSVVGNENAEVTGRHDVVVVPSLVSSAKPWEDIDKEQRMLKQEMTELSQHFLPGHPKMLALQKKLDDTQKRLEFEYENAKTKFDLEYINLSNRRDALEAKLPEYREISKMNEKIQQDASLFNSSQLEWAKMYAEMAKTVNALDFAALKERVNLEYNRMEECKANPVSPNKMRIFMIAIMGGLGLALSVPFLIEYLDHTVSNIEQIEATFRMRGLGIIPKVDMHGHAQESLVDPDTVSNGNLIENFRVIRTNLLSVGSLTKAPQVIMVTSSMPKEGKTVVSSNLALSFAHTGVRTLVMDTDLRRGRLHRLFGLRKNPGLSDLLLGQISLDDAIRPTNKENLSILTAGQHLDSGAELIGSQRFRELMEEMRGRFDRIVIDTPPVLGLSETSILQRYVDGVMFVVWSGRTPMRTMKTAVEMLQANGANFYGFILNRLDLSATANYYQYYYYSNDYYHNYHALENA